MSSYDDDDDGDDFDQLLSRILHISLQRHNESVIMCVKYMCRVEKKEQQTTPHYDLSMIWIRIVWCENNKQRRQYGSWGRIGRWWGNSIVSDIFSRQIMIEFSLCSGTAKPTNRQSIYRTSPLTPTWLDSIHHSIWNFIGITSYENEKEWNSEVRKNIVKVVRLFLWHNHDGNLWWFSPTLCWVRSTRFTLSWYVSRQKKKEQGRSVSNLFVDFIIIFSHSLTLGCFSGIISHLFCLLRTRSEMKLLQIVNFWWASSEVIWIELWMMNSWIFNLEKFTLLENNNSIQHETQQTTIIIKNINTIHTTTRGGKSLVWGVGRSVTMSSEWSRWMHKFKINIFLSVTLIWSEGFYH